MLHQIPRIHYSFETDACVLFTAIPFSDDDAWQQNRKYGTKRRFCDELFHHYSNSMLIKLLMYRIRYFMELQSYNVIIT